MPVNRRMAPPRRMASVEVSANDPGMKPRKASSGEKFIAPVVPSCSRAVAPVMPSTCAPIIVQSEYHTVSPDIEGV